VPARSAATEMAKMPRAGSCEEFTLER
jgi:hypothetical protein